MSRISSFADSLVNLITSLGTSHDSNYSNQYAFNQITWDQLTKAYRGDWLARKIVDIPAQDATREWRVWEGDAEQVRLIEAEEARVALGQKVKAAMIKDRLLGGAAIVIGVDGTGDWDQPLDPRKVRPGSLKFLHTVDRNEIKVSELNHDLTSPFYGEPKSYTVTSTTGHLEIHPSRVVRFVSNPIPTYDQRADDGWGDSVLQALDTAIKNAGLSAEGIAALIPKASVDVIKMPDFMQNVATEEYRQRIIDRFQLANTAKSMVNALILDSEEEWDNLEVNFGGLPDLLRVYLNIAAGAGDIPATRLLGQSPTGLNATGESDIRNYYDNIRSSQKNEIGPLLERVDEVLIRSALGDRPPEIGYEWVSLWQPSAKERAEVLFSRSQAIVNIYNTGYVDDAAMAEGVKGMLVEDGSFPGLETALEETETDIDETNLADAKPRPLYVSRRVLNAGEIVKWAKAQGIQNVIPADKMHVTITYSTTPVNWLQMGEAWVNEDGILRIPEGGPRVVELMGSDDDTLVLSFASSELEWRHRGMVERGASWNHDEYQPHITLAVDVDEMPEDIEPYRGEIRLGPEIFEEIVEDWKSTLL